MDKRWEYVTSLVLAGIFFALLYWKKHRQLGGVITNVRVRVNDAILRCQVCQGETFDKREGLLSTTWATIVRLEAFNESAHCVTCCGCGHAHWFASRWVAGSGKQHPGAWIRYEAARPARDDQR